MKFFVDTANIKEIENLLPTGFVDGVTTNPSLIAKQGDDMAKTITRLELFSPRKKESVVVVKTAIVIAIIRDIVLELKSIYFVNI